MIHTVLHHIGIPGRKLLAGSAICLWLLTPSHADIHKVDNASLENLIDASKVAVATLDKVGQPISDSDRKLLLTAWELTGDEAVGKIQDIMDRYCWLEIHIPEEPWLTAEAASPSPSDRRLVQGKWKAFLVKIYNESAVKAAVNVRSPQALSPEELKAAEAGTSTPAEPNSWYRWLGLQIYPNATPAKDFPGNTVRYLVTGIFSRDEGIRAADLEFFFAGGAVSQGHYTSKRLLFEIAPAADK